jgi:hypothetical protein
MDSLPLPQAHQRPIIQDHQRSLLQEDSIREAYRPALSAGLLALWNPGTLLFFEILWLAAFIHTGRSRVTGATVRLHVVEGNI